MNKRTLFCAAYAVTAALALCLLCGCGGAPAQDTSEPVGPAQADTLPLSAGPEEGTDYIGLINAELDELRELGLFHLEFEAVRNGKERGERGGIDKVGIQNFQSDAPCSYSVDFDKASGKITRLNIVAGVQEDWETVVSETGVEVYDRLDAIIDPDMTLGEYCALWAQYRGYESWELPEGVDGDTLCLDAPALEQWAEGIYDSMADLASPGLTISFYRAGETEPVPVYIQYTPTTAGPEINLGEDIVRG